MISKCANPQELNKMKKAQFIFNDELSFFGGDEGDRTPYLLTASQALSQVSYTPIWAPGISGAL